MAEPKHYGIITNGERQYYNEAYYNSVMKELEGKEFVETIKLKPKRVSLDAFGYYYGGVVGSALNDEMFGGWTKDDVDDFFSDMFLSFHKPVAMTIGGHTENVYLRKVTSKGAGFTSKQMSEYTEKVIIWLATHGIPVMTPEQYYSQN